MLYRYLLILILSFIFVNSCGLNNLDINALIDDYERDGDIQKANAAKFISTNIKHHYSYDTTNLSYYRDVLLKLDSLRKANLDLLSLRRVWKDKNNEMNVYSTIYSNKRFDNTVITKQFLKNNIDNAFEAWQDNPYTKDADFNVFCNYILPYKRRQGMVVEDWRDEFNDAKQLLDSLYIKGFNIVEAVDSILNTHKDIKRGLPEMDNFPYLKLDDIVLSRMGPCEMGTIYNAIEFASIGIPVAIDCIPAWGNRGSSHMWNTLITNDAEYSFDPYYELDRWKYKELYNNRSIHENWGKFRLPKVFRHTYQAFISDLHKEEKAHKIPKFFRNPMLLDVSTKYFEGVNITIDIPEDIAAKNKFIWICVFNNSVITPVFWAKVDGLKATFRDMGRDVLYFIATYDKGKTTVFGDPFYINNDGVSENYKPNERHCRSISLKRKYPHLNFSNEKILESLSVLKVVSNSQPIAVDPIRIAPCNNKYSFPENIKKGEVELIFPYTNILYNRTNKYGDYRDIAEIIFLDSAENVIKADYPNYFTPMFDNDDLTYFKAVSSPFAYKDIKIKIKTESDVNHIVIVPRNDRNYIYDGLDYQLMYWNNEWKSLGIAKGSKDFDVEFKYVPENSLLWLKCLSEGKEERPFVFICGTQHWL